MQKKNHFLIQAVQLGGLTLISSGLGFLREILIAGKFGATHVTDSYLVGLSVPMVIYGLFFGSGLNVSLVPRLTAALNENLLHGRKVFAQFLSGAALWSLLVSCLIFLAPREFIHVFAPGIANSPLTAGFTRALSPLLFLFVISFAFGSFHCARQKASHWGFVTVVQNGTLVAALLFLTKVLRTEVLIWGTLSGAFLALVLQGYLARRDGFREPWVSPFRAGEGKRALLSMIPFALVFGVGGDYGTGIVDNFLIRFFASKLEAGSITLLSLGNKLMALPVLMIGAALGIALLPHLSASLTKGRNKEATNAFAQAISFAFLLACPIAILYMDLGTPLARLTFRRTSLAASQLGELGVILEAYSGAVLGLALAFILNAYLAALQRTRALIGAGIVTIGIDAFLMWALRAAYQTRGIAMAVSIGSFCYCFFLLALLGRDLGQAPLGELLKRCSLILTGAAAMHFVLVGTLRLNVFAAVPWLGGALFPALTGFSLYVGWVVFHRSRFQFESAGA